MEPFREKLYEQKLRIAYIFETYMKVAILFGKTVIQADPNSAPDLIKHFKYF